jgi:hypothetical protein
MPAEQGLRTVSITRELSRPAVFLIPAQHMREGNHPDSFNLSRTIRYGLPEPARVSIAVYSVLGQEVVRLLDDEKPAGIHELVWDGRAGEATTLSSGVYLCRMVATGASGRSQVATIRMKLHRDFFERHGS